MSGSKLVVTTCGHSVGSNLESKVNAALRWQSPGKSRQLGGIGARCGGFVARFAVEINSGRRLIADR